MDMLARDEDILKAAEDWRKAGRGVALATVVETWGSAPRPVGSNLVIDDEGNFLGSVSGGCVEGAVVTEAHRRDRERQAEDAGIRRRRRDRLEGRAVLRRHDPGLCREGGVGADRAEGIGTDLWHRYSSREMKLDILTRSNAERAARRAAVVVTDVASGEQRLVKAGRHRRAIRCRTCSKSTSAAARAAWRKRRRASVFLTVHVPPPRLVITGAVHISQALAPMAQAARLRRDHRRSAHRLCLASSAFPT